MAHYDGGPVYPCEDFGVPHAGLTLRDYFAGIALMALIRRGGEELPQSAYRLADAMLLARATVCPRPEEAKEAA